MKASPLRIVLLLLVFAATASARPTTAASQARVLVISVDGLRPDVLLRSDAPNIRALMQRGAFTMWAETTDVAITLPSHVSMLTGVTPDRHGIHWNSKPKPGEPRYPAVPTLFQLATESGYTTALVAGKVKFTALARPGTVTWAFVPDKVVVDSAAVAEAAVAMIRDHRPQVLFVHLPDVDSAGHRIGWGTPEQLAAVAHADAAIGRVLATLKSADLLDRTTIILSADHGGSGRTHGAKDPRSRYIPWIIAGPGIRADYDLTRDRALTVHTEDTFATACRLLHLTPPEPIDGHAVLQAFESPTEARKN